MTPEATFDQRQQHVNTQLNFAGTVHADHLGTKIHLKRGDYVNGNKYVIVYQQPLPEKLPTMPFALPKVIEVAACSFMMGDDTRKHASPCHPVKLPTFFISLSPITNRDFHNYLIHHGVETPEGVRWVQGNSPSAEQEAKPVRGVNWHESLAYCEWLASVTGKPYTLPSEAQWECAAKRWPKRYFRPRKELLEWTTTLWGERRGMPDDRYRYPWHPNDGRDNLAINNQIRRVTRGGSRTITRRTSELPKSNGLGRVRTGFRVCYTEETSHV